MPSEMQLNTAISIAIPHFSSSNAQAPFSGPLQSDLTIAYTQ